MYSITVKATKAAGFIIRGLRFIIQDSSSLTLSQHQDLNITQVLALYILCAAVAQG